MMPSPERRKKPLLRGIGYQVPFNSVWRVNKCYFIVVSKGNSSGSPISDRITMLCDDISWWSDLFFCVWVGHFLTPGKTCRQHVAACDLCRDLLSVVVVLWFDNSYPPDGKICASIPRLFTNERWATLERKASCSNLFTPPPPSIWKQFRQRQQWTGYTIPCLAATEL